MEFLSHSTPIWEISLSQGFLHQALELLSRSLPTLGGLRPLGETGELLWVSCRRAVSLQRGWWTRRWAREPYLSTVATGGTLREFHLITKIARTCSILMRYSNNFRRCPERSYPYPFCQQRLETINKSKMIQQLRRERIGRLQTPPLAKILPTFNGSIPRRPKPPLGKESLTCSESQRKSNQKLNKVCQSSEKSKINPNKTPHNNHKF